MMNEILESLPVLFRKGIFAAPTTFYFSVDDIKKTVTLDGEGCSIQDGKTAGEADCVCKTSTDMFRKIWNDGYRPGIMDFLGGAIKSNNPQLLQQFLTAFGK